MSRAIFKGLSACLTVTVLIVAVGLLGNMIGFSQINVSNWVDIGLVACCLAGGYVSGKESSLWLLGGVTGGGFIALAAGILSVFLPVNFWGAVQVVCEGTLVGLLGGVAGRYGSRKVGGTWHAADNARYRRSKGIANWEDRFQHKDSYEKYAAEEPLNRETYSNKEKEDGFEKFHLADSENGSLDLDDEFEEKKRDSWILEKEKSYPWWEQDAVHKG